MEIPPACTRVETSSRIVRKERRRLFVLANPNRVRVQVVDVDGCAITDGQRCDWLFLPPGGKEIYLELKGRHVGEGIRQLEATISRLSADKGGVPKYCYLVPTSVRRPMRTEIQVAKDRFDRQYRAKLIVKAKQAEHRIDL